MIEDAAESWPVVASQPLLKNWLITVRSDKVRLPDDQYAERTVVTHPGAVAILALDDAQRVLMIRQYRHSVGRLLWEIPAGLRDTDGESPLQTAQRELLEETGYRASRWHTLLDYFSSPGYSTERIRIFLAR
ncbi:MAG: NUDIX domain-containing protein, partial [Solirubrobacteraceae bacterium]